MFTQNRCTRSLSTKNHWYNADLTITSGLVGMLDVLDNFSILSVFYHNLTGSAQTSLYIFGLNYLDIIC